MGVLPLREWKKVWGLYIKFINKRRTIRRQQEKSYVERFLFVTDRKLTLFG